MIVYADRKRQVRASDFQAQAETASDPVDRLMLHGQWEAGVLDALLPEQDDLVDLDRPPEHIAVGPQEGFAYYALYPEHYRDAALRFERERRPHACVVIGIRTIGTTLSRVVADALQCPVWRVTVRPRGHPFERRLRLSERFENELRGRVDQWFLVVDEGPGLSGSSFISVAEKLSEFGVPDERIVLFPSHMPDPAGFRSERARSRWPRHPVYFEPFRAESFVPEGAADLSGGQWRALLGCEDIRVAPPHERRKYLHDGVLYKYEGLGFYGRGMYERAQRLHDAGFFPAPLGFENGFLRTRWAPGRPARAVTPELVDAAARYLAHLAANFDTGRPVRYGELREMLRVNAGVEAPEQSALLENQSAVAIDGRMMLHEWIETDAGWVKTDALHHHDDHFFPGTQDIAWDVAGMAVEWGIGTEAAAEAFLRYRREPELHARVPFYETAYRAYRRGYEELAWGGG